MNSTSLRALVVDDNSVCRRLGSILCRRAGYEAIETDRGSAALSLARGAGFAFALIDVCMPGLDGVQLGIAFRADPALRQTKIIAYTGKRAATKDVKDFEFDSILKKPADFDSFIAALVKAGLPFPAS